MSAIVSQNPRGVCERADGSHVPEKIRRSGRPSLNITCPQQF